MPSNNADAAGRTESEGRTAAGCKLISMGAASPREFALDRARIAVGSHPNNDLVLSDRAVSRRHAVIAQKSGGYEVTDLESTNGTFVNGRRVTGTVALKRGDEIRFGSVRFAFAGAEDSKTTIRGARTATRLRRGVAMLATMFAAGFFAVTYRGEIGRMFESMMSGISRLAAHARIAGNATSDAPATGALHADSSPVRPTVPDAAAPGWLKRLNFYRAMAHLPSVFEASELSKGDHAHAVYVVRNYRDAIEHGTLGAEVHTEDPGNSLFTPEGLEAAKSSDLDGWYLRGEPDDKRDAAGAADPDEWKSERAPGTPEWSIDGWMSIPFHRMPMLNPDLKTAGFGRYCESGACAAGLNLTKGSSEKAPKGPLAAGPLVFPPNGSTVPMRSFGNEWPDPRTSCTGYAPPSGLALTLELGWWMDTRLGDYSVALEDADGNQTALDACGFDSTTYSNPDGYAQQLGREILKSYGAVVVIPRAPLAPNSKYAVAITANDKTYRWTFSTGP